MGPKRRARSRLDPSPGKEPQLYETPLPAGNGPSCERALLYLAVSVGVLGRYALDVILFKKRDRVAEEKREWLKIPAA